MQNILLEQLDGDTVSFETKFSESLLARIHFMVRAKSLKEISYSVADIEKKLVESARSWSDDLYDALNDHLGEEKANALFKLYGNSFQLSYKEIFSARAAVVDIEHIEKLKTHDQNYLQMSLYRPIEDTGENFRFKIFRNDLTIPLSDVVPILEKMGLRIISERSHEIKIYEDGVVWINDYCMTHPKADRLEPDLVKDRFQDAFAAVWHGLCENDGFNKLVLSADLSWRDISILRANYRFLWQTGLAFSQSYVEDAMNNNSLLANKLIDYFYSKFDPSLEEVDRGKLLKTLKQALENSLDKVSSLNEDRIIRHYLSLLEAMVRTNFFQVDQHNLPKVYCAYKFDSSKIPELPLPKPLCEIFVYSPQVEAVHLRGDRVARGGIRWSDRHEDFRTEVLGLMKAQQVKNAVIVPLGAKGGFVVKTPTAVVTDCYKIFIRGLLDLTDNNKGDQVIKPESTICWDADDTYLVVAADKGTATFSDMANELSLDYGFWLGDAFASGGSAGYDHKKLAITARGAWESVKMHFKYLGVDLHTQSITVIGIGDMAGDVFGNGMLLSSNLKLIAAFNHMHIFFDPDPDPALSFKERERLFKLPASKWSDYKTEVISYGGGVFERSAKKIPLSPEMQRILDSSSDSIEPNDLIRQILRLKVDLLYNGGIGTFVKSVDERNADVGDRVNDAIRINGEDLGVKVVCEGGNLGFTQLGRIEYAKLGGLINTDAIDNSAGVNCSDNEVNIKILLNEVVAGGDITEKQRNELLASMSHEVADLVLANNLKQNEAITLTVHQAAANLQMHDRLLKELQRTAGLDPVVEFLPDADELAYRTTAQLGFTRPEIAVLMAYTKIFIKKQLLNSNVPDEAYANISFMSYFPKALQDPKYSQYLQGHRLKRAIIATQISNLIVDGMGINFIQRLEEESGSSCAEIARAYMAVREIFDASNIRAGIRDLPCKVTSEIKLGVIQNFNRLLRRATRWFLRNSNVNFDIEQTIVRFKPMVSELQQQIDEVLTGAWLETMNTERARLVEAGVTLELAKKASRFYAMFTALDIIAAAQENATEIIDVARVYFAIGGRLQLGWFGEMVNKQPVRNNWEALARAAFRDDVDKQQRNLTISILNSVTQENIDVETQVETWLMQHDDLLKRWESVVAELKVSNPEFTMFAVALRELLNLSTAK